VSDKPAHLSSDWAAQFTDRAVVAAYHTRPPYPEEVFDVLESLLPPGARRVLELGCGSGDLTLRLAPRVTSLDALDVSEPMLELARRRAGAGHANVRWLHSSAEAHETSDTYSLIVAAESFHWMDWHAVLPRCARWLEPSGVFAVVDGRAFVGLPWHDELDSLLRTHSTNQTYQPIDLISELSRRGLFRELGRRRTKPEPIEQSVDDYIESFHSRNGFSRDRMTPESAAEFDAGVRAAVLRHAPDGIVRAGHAAHVVWGRPLSGEAPAARR
jgi:ubiquinone/menaquinone biosynthesis C-methylase UbiE